MAALAEVSKDNFNDLVADGTVLVDVWGPQCMPCLALNPHVEAVAERRPELSVVKLEAPKNRRLCIDMRVMGMPTFLLFRDGEEVARLSDPELSPARLDEWLDEVLDQESRQGLDQEGGGSSAS